MRFRVVNIQFKANFQDFFTCHPGKYTALPVQHTRTQKKLFPCLIFGARISNLASKYGKVSSIVREFGGAFVQLLQ